MILVEDEAALDEWIAEGTRGEIKFISIMDKFYAIALGELVRSNEYKKLKTSPLVITKELLQSFPKPRYDTKVITYDVIRQKPIVMFETPEVNDVYYRFDGRHRILAAANIGFDWIHAKWVPKSMWGKYIVGKPVDPVKDAHMFEVLDEPFEALPFSWSRPPNLHDSKPSYHIEPNFVIPDLQKIDDRQRMMSSNADLARLLVR